LAENVEEGIVDNELEIEIEDLKDRHRVLKVVDKALFKKLEDLESENSETIAKVFNKVRPLFKNPNDLKILEQEAVNMIPFEDTAQPVIPVPSVPLFPSSTPPSSSTNPSSSSDSPSNNPSNSKRKLTDLDREDDSKKLNTENSSTTDSESNWSDIFDSF
jgi:hypothetical protein